MQGTELLIIRLIIDITSHIKVHFLVTCTYTLIELKFESNYTVMQLLQNKNSFNTCFSSIKRQTYKKNIQKKTIFVSFAVIFTLPHHTQKILYLDHTVLDPKYVYTYV